MRELFINDEASNSSGHGINVTYAIVPEPPLYLVISASLCYFLIFIFGVLGNTLVILVVFKSKAMKNAVNYFMVNLCTADLLVLLFCMPTCLVDVFEKEVWHFGEAMCKAVPYLEQVVSGASIITIACICIERYKATCNPLKAKSRELCRILKQVPVIWSVAAVCAIPHLFIAEYRPSMLMDGTPIYVCRVPIKYIWQKIYIVLLTFLFYVLPFSVLVVLYCMICKILTPGAQSLQCEACSMALEQSRRIRHQVKDIMLLIVLVFFLCHLPFRAVSLWLIFEDMDVLRQIGLETHLNILYASRITFYLNHALNPILYNFISKRFRREVPVVLKRFRTEESAV